MIIHESMIAYYQEAMIIMTSFAIIRTKKHKHIASIIRVARHHAREVACATADLKNHLTTNHGGRKVTFTGCR